MGGWDGFLSALTDPVSLGIITGLVLGKPIGILGTTWLLTKLTKARLDPSFKWIDLLGVAVLAGIGFTVSLLVADLSFGQGTLPNDHAKVGILTASVLAVASSPPASHSHRAHRAHRTRTAPALAPLAPHRTARTAPHRAHRTRTRARTARAAPHRSRVAVCAESRRCSGDTRA